MSNLKVTVVGENLLQAVKFNRGKQIQFKTTETTVLARVGSSGKFNENIAEVFQQLPKPVRRKARKALYNAGWTKMAHASVR